MPLMAAGPCSARGGAAKLRWERRASLQAVELQAAMEAGALGKCSFDSAVTSDSLAPGGAGDKPFSWRRTGKEMWQHCPSQQDRRQRHVHPRR